MALGIALALNAETTDELFDRRNTFIADCSGNQMPSLVKAPSMNLAPGSPSRRSNADCTRLVGSSRRAARSAGGLRAPDAVRLAIDHRPLGRRALAREQPSDADERALHVRWDSLEIAAQIGQQVGERG